MQNQTTDKQDHCKACNHILQSSSQKTCNHCGYPLQGTQEEQQHFLVYREVSQIDFESHQKHINSARNILLYMALIILIPIPILFFTGIHGNSLLFALINCIAMAILFIGLAMWSVIKPTAALVTGLCLYLGMIAIKATIDLQSVKPDILFGIIITLCLVNGIHSSLKADKLVKEYKFS